MADDLIPESLRGRMADDEVVWLTTVAADGTPQPKPVWFLWEGDGSVLTFSRPDAKRLRHVRARPRVSLNLNSTPKGGEVLVLTGDAEILTGSPVDFPAYIAKYRSEMERIVGSVEEFDGEYSVPMRITVTSVRSL
ncbi:TIGR03667 family PPOX class F420-dependent oxidoreductase [Nonomuraea cavernae]|uniref:TIGR03667 family PPOX class F420-dependent oxidoreductase n=1 Tax=Nonomuraea cavernae TaxID=2045107 RepID=UPI00340E9AC2